MTRLIDADALKKSIDEHVYLVHHGFNETEYGCTQYGIHQIIDEAPTIDAIPVEWILNNERMPTEGKGHDAIIDMIADWKDKAEPMRHGKWRFVNCATGLRCQCSECLHWVDAGTDKNYCPYCGARMDKE